MEKVRTKKEKKEKKKNTEMEKEKREESHNWQAECNEAVALSLCYYLRRGSFPSSCYGQQGTVRSSWFFFGRYKSIMRHIVAAVSPLRWTGAQQ